MTRGGNVATRNAINPWSWAAKLGFDQAQLIEGQRRQLEAIAID